MHALNLNPYQPNTEVADAESVLPADANAGRTFIVALIVVNVLLALSVIGLALATGNNDRLPRLLIRLVVNIGFMYALWNGTVWTKWLFVLGLVLTAGLLISLPIRFLNPIMYLAIPFSVLSAWCGWNLAFGKSVQEFLGIQREQAADE